MHPPAHHERPLGREAVQSALVDSAIVLIAQRGVSGVSTRDIAAHARVNQGLITRYFGTKTALLRRVAHQVAEQLFQEVSTSATLDLRLLAGTEGRRTLLRALIFLMLDDQAATAELAHSGLTERFLDWLRNQAGVNVGEGTTREAQVFLFAAVVLGTEVVGRAMADEVRHEALGLFLKAFAPAGP